MSNINSKHSKEIDILNSTYKTQIIELENQLKKQRDRTLALLDEKEQEVSTLKSSFQIFLPGSQKKFESLQVIITILFVNNIKMLLILRVINIP